MSELEHEAVKLRSQIPLVSLWWKDAGMSAKVHPWTSDVIFS